MARKNYSRRKTQQRKRKTKKFKKYSFVERMNYYDEKASRGKTVKEQDFAIGYLQGMRGIVDNRLGTDSGEAGNKAGLRFWHKMTKTKI